VNVPFFRPNIGQAEIDEVVEVLRSGWLTTGPRVQRFEQGFAEAVGARYAVAVNSCTAAMHLAVEALGLGVGDAVLVPTMTFAASAEVVRYVGAHPILVDCEPDTTNMDLEDAEAKIDMLRKEELPPGSVRLKGIMPVHVGGLMMNVARLHEIAGWHDLWIVEDAAHAFPAAWKKDEGSHWQRSGENTAQATCYSFYSNKTITTGEGGMVVTRDEDLAARMRSMSLHGLSGDAWERYSSRGAWDYRIAAPGFKYNLTDVAAAVGLHQLARAEEMRRERQSIAERYIEKLGYIEEIELPPRSSDRIHAWHLFRIMLHLDRLKVTRDEFVDQLCQRGVGFSVHWRPLHMHPYYQEVLGWRPEHCPVATRVWERLVSLPIFCGLTPDEMDHVITSIEELVRLNRR
jgi:perosamine synthetase